MSLRRICVWCVCKSICRQFCKCGITLKKKKSLFKAQDSDPHPSPLLACTLPVSVQKYLQGSVWMFRLSVKVCCNRDISEPFPASSHAHYCFWLPIDWKSGTRALQTRSFSVQTHNKMFDCIDDTPLPAGKLSLCICPSATQGQIRDTGDFLSVAIIQQCVNELNWSSHVLEHDFIRWPQPSSEYPGDDTQLPLLWSGG